MCAIEPAELRGHRVILRPLRPEHAAGVLAAADSDEVFTWLAFPRFTELKQVRAWVDEALGERRADRRIPFVVLRATDGAVIGSTSYRDLDARNARVEIGSTWFSRASWGTGANMEAKLLLMTHGFETLGLERVFLRADNLNLRSQRANEKLGAVREGVHRHEVLRRDGSWCDSIHYSVLRSEWPKVKAQITKRLQLDPRHQRGSAAVQRGVTP
jgi:N-acetyltransferase